MNKTTISVERELLNKLKIRAIHRGVNLQTLVADYLNKALKEKH